MINTTERLTFEAQTALIQRCIKEGVELETALQELRLDYNSLCYRHSAPHSTLFDAA